MLTKLFIFIFIFAIIIVIREIWSFVKALYLNTKNVVPTNRLIALGLSIAYIITIICTGF